MARPWQPRRLTPLLGGLLLAGLSGCATYRAPFQPPQGLLVSAVKAPLQLDSHAGVPAAPGGHGQASTFYFHDPLITGLSFAWDDCALARASRNGGLQRLDYADYEYLMVLGIFGRMTVHAYGPVAAAAPR
ncbi:MAG: hypothetical protein WC789_10345 [Lentisphaeria bacterium]|jgi:hypothetical protein